MRRAHGVILALLMGSSGFAGSNKIKLTDPVGEKAFCNVSATGVGICEYENLKQCQTSIREKDEACLARKAVSEKPKIAKEQQIEASRSRPKSELGRILADFFPGETCIDTKRLPYEIVAKFDDHHYEMRGDNKLTPPHAVLETTRSIFGGTGHPLGLKIQYVGQKEMKLENGFSTGVDQWLECEKN